MRRCAPWSSTPPAARCVSPPTSTTPSPAPARRCRRPRVRRLPHRPAHRRRRARASGAGRSSPATRSSARSLATGDGRRAWSPAARVGVPWLGWTCGECRYCRSGRENLCVRAAVHRPRHRRRLRRRAPSPTRASASPLPDGYDDLEAAPLLCAGLIGHRALRMSGDAERLGLYGFGASAHIVCQVALHQGRRVFAFTRAGDDRGAGVRALARLRVGGRRDGPAAGGARRGDRLRPRRRARPGGAARRSRPAGSSSAPAST